MDASTDRVYQYNGATTRLTGSQEPAATFNLAATNANPQGIADPLSTGPGLIAAPDLLISPASAIPVASAKTSSRMTDVRNLVRSEFDGSIDHSLEKSGTVSRCAISAKPVRQPRSSRLQKKTVQLSQSELPDDRKERQPTLGELDDVFSDVALLLQ